MRMLLLAGIIATASYAATVQFQVTDLGGSLHRYNYSVSGYTFQMGDELDISFDPLLYGTLTNGLALTGFDVVVIQPNNPPGAQGLYSTAALVNNPSLTGVFSVDFTFSGPGMPGAQPFAIDSFDSAGIHIKASGFTVPSTQSAVPESSSMVLFSAGAILVGIFRTLRRRPPFILSCLAVSALSLQAAPGLSITNYQLISEQRITRTTSNFTYKADLVNSGPPQSSVAATLTSAGLGIQAIQGNLHFTPVPAASQTTSSDTFTVLVDRTIPVDFTTLIWSFQATPLAPVANAGPDRSAKVGSLVTLDGSKSTNPSGIGALTYNWVFTGRPAGSTAFLANPTSVNPTFVPDVAGNYLITLTVGNGSATSSASVTVSTTLPPPPVANAGPDQTLPLGSTAVLNGSGSTSGSGNPLTFFWTLTSIPAGSGAVLTGPNTVSPTFVIDKNGTYSVQLVVNDGVASSAPSVVKISTSVVKPVANAGPAQLVNVNSLVQLDGSASTDANGLPLTYKWSLNSAPAGSSAALSGTSAVKPAFTADRPGSYIWQLIVNNGVLSSDPATVMVTTNPVVAPTANAGPNQTVAFNSTVQLNGSGTDVQNLPLTFLWSLITKPTGSSANLSNTVIPNPAFVADKTGTFVAQLTVNNGYLNSPAVTVMVSTTCTQPVANAGPSQSVTVGATVTLDGTGSSDACHDSLTYSWTLLSAPAGSTAALAGTNTASPTFTADKPGTFVAQLIVNNGFQASLPSTVTITAVPQTTITLAPNPLTVPATTSGTLSVSLSAVAGAGGQVVNLSSNMTNIATVPQSVTIPSGQMSATIPVTGVAVGSAVITGSASGLVTGTAVVNVVTPNIAVTLDAASVGISKSINGTIVLSAPAPAGGLTVSISIPGGLGYVQIQPTFLNIAAGKSTGSFTVTGNIEGSTTITASANGYTSGTVDVSVFPLGKLILPATVDVGLGLSVPFPVTLAAPALEDLNINLVIVNPQGAITLPSNVVILKGATSPIAQPQVTGIDIGTEVVIANCPSCTQSSASFVHVGAALGFAQGSATIDAGATLSLTLKLLGGQAPSGGLTVNLKSNDTNVVTVPPTATFAAGSTSVNVPVTGIAGGLATVIANNPHLSDAGVVISVNPGKIVLPATLNVNAGQTATLAVTLSAPSPSDLTVTLTSSDTSKATVPASIVIAKGATAPATPPQVTGVAAGAANITASAPGYTQGGPTAVTVSGAANLDGNWSGTTGQGKSFSFVIASSTVTSMKYTSNFTKCGIETTTTFNTATPVIANSFSINTANASISGTITQGLQASGTLSDTINPVTGCIQTVQTTWTATKQ